MAYKFIILDRTSPDLKNIIKKIAVVDKKFLCLVDDTKFKNKNVSSSITLKNGSFMPCPSDQLDEHNKIQRTILYCAGPSGSGKSTIINQFKDTYNLLYPNNNTYIFSKIVNDTSLKKERNTFYISIDEDLIFDPLESSDFKNSLVIMDDVDTLSKELKKPIKYLQADIGELGRHDFVSLAVSSHEICKSHETKSIISESHIVVMYMSSGYCYDYYLTKYLGVNKKQIENIKRISADSRWVAIYKQYPLILLTQTKVLLMSDL
jgi:hypothetical protein